MTNCLFCPAQQLTKDNLKVRHCSICQTKYHFTTKAVNILTSYHIPVQINHRRYVAHFYTEHLRTIKEPSYYKDIAMILSHVDPDGMNTNLLTLAQYPDWTPFNIQNKLRILLPFL